MPAHRGLRTVVVALVLPVGYVAKWTTTLAAAMLKAPFCGHKSRASKARQLLLLLLPLLLLVVVSTAATFPYYPSPPSSESAFVRCISLLCGT